ncbi:unnamed protein product [Caretta caretta]
MVGRRKADQSQSDDAFPALPGNACPVLCCGITSRSCLPLDCIAGLFHSIKCPDQFEGIHLVTGNIPYGQATLSANLGFFLIK